MQVSCKVSYSVIVYLERQGAQMERFFEKFETPVEFFKDPSGWVEVPEMENFLVAVSEFLNVQNPQNFYREIGQQNFDLRAWGVLDSVLNAYHIRRNVGIGRY